MSTVASVVEERCQRSLRAAVAVLRYNTYIAHYKEAECFRLDMEKILYDAGVDMVFSGQTDRDGGARGRRILAQANHEYAAFQPRLGIVPSDVIEQLYFAAKVRSAPTLMQRREARGNFGAVAP